MAFLKKIWANRQREYPNRRKLVPTGTENEYEVSRSEGTVLNEGDLLDADNLNDLEERIGAAFNEIAAEIAKLRSETMAKENFDFDESSGTLNITL